MMKAVTTLLISILLMGSLAHGKATEGSSSLSSEDAGGSEVGYSILPDGEAVTLMRTRENNEAIAARFIKQVFGETKAGAPAHADTKANANQ